ncbi:Hypothetical predicted protein [Paramuricea clavata]|uniref:Uncharacterized protein n=1 Tax=Paramuricea clavata TaxID=317549 RepID=A0A7D9IE89_PARCT|nr:Hypothetical predicted protein [Paramuricea clavata]
MANNMRKRLAYVWFMKLKRKRDIVQNTWPECAYSSRIPRDKIHKRRLLFVEAILAYLHRPRIRDLWMHPRSLIWFDMVDETFCDELWYANFRVRKQTFSLILEKVERDICRISTPMRIAVSARRRLALTLYFLASTAEYRTIGNLFGVSRSFTCQCVKEVCCAIIKQFPKAITFPKGDELHQVLQGYEERWGFPMCAGAIDGTHIPILAPTDNHVEYVNRKGFHSVLMQAVTDCNYLFRDVVIGWPGRVHDARVFSNSTIFRRGNEQQLFPRDLVKEICGVDIPPFLVGDPAYPLLPWLLKGYPRNEASENQRKFNYQLSRARMTVENTFGRWKGRFPRFHKRVDMEVPSLIEVVHASCVLHNICEIRKDDFLPNWEEPNVFEEQIVAFDEIDAPDVERIRSALTEHFS